MPDRPEEAWRKGYLAGFDDLAASANPYKRGSLLAADWDDGWREGAHPRGRPVEGGFEAPEA
jgi:ribosome modulation factor